MKLRDLFEKWNLTGLKIKVPILEMDWAPRDVDKDAAWDLYVELLTRVATQPIEPEHGVEQSALDSISLLFSVTRETLKHHGRGAIGFSRVAIVVLNQIVRPFTAKWHLLSKRGAFGDVELREQFRAELTGLQRQLRNYTGLLADLAEVEDLSHIEPTGAVRDDASTPEEAQ